MKSLIFSCLVLLISCNQKNKIGHSSDTNILIGDSVKSSVKNKKELVSFDADTVNHFINTPMGSVDSINPLLKRDLFTSKAKVMGVKLDKSNLTANIYDLYVVNKLFLPKTVIKGMEYNSLNSNYVITDLYYFSQKDTEDVFYNIKQQIDSRANENESFNGYFKPCGLYILFKSNRLTIIRKINCWQKDKLRELFKKNSRFYDKIVYFQNGYDVPGTREIILLDEIK